MKRVLIKVSGEALSSAAQPVCFEKVEETAREIKLLYDAGLEIGIVVGGGKGAIALVVSDLYDLCGGVNTVGMCRVRM